MIIAYSMVNRYLRGNIQAGIQAAHSQTEMILNIHDGFNQNFHKMLESWRPNPTMILKSGGDMPMMETLLAEIENQSVYPFGYFREPGLGHALTSITLLMDSEDIFESPLPFVSLIAGARLI